MTFRTVGVAAVALALGLAAPALAGSDPVEERSPQGVEQPATASHHTVEARAGAPEQAGPTLYRVGARTDGHFPYAYPFAGPPQVLPMLPVALIAGSGLGF